MSQNSNLNILMQKLYAMEKKLGVNSGPKDKKKDADEFNQTQIEALELLDFIKKKQDERDQKIQKLGNNPETLRLAAEIKDKISELEKLIEKLNEAVRKQIKNPKKYSKAETDGKQKQYTKFVQILKDLRTREQGINAKPVEEVKTITELKRTLLEGGSKKSAAERGVDRDLHEDEKAALEEFAKVDKEQNDIVGNINEVLEVLKGKAKGIGDNVNLQTALIQDLDKNVDEVNDQIQSSNAKLKRVLDEYRKPSKFCMDVCLMLLLMGSIGVLIKVLQW